MPGCSDKQLGASIMPEHSARRSFGNRLFCLQTCNVEVANHKHGPPSIQAQVDPVVQHLPNEQQQSLLYPLQALLWLLKCKFVRWQQKRIIHLRSLLFAPWRRHACSQSKAGSTQLPLRPQKQLLVEISLHLWDVQRLGPRLQHAQLAPIDFVLHLGLVEAGR